MGCEQAIIAKLLATSGVTALIGERVYPGVRPQASAVPAVVLNLISAIPSYSDDGEDGIQEDRLQIDCWGETYASIKALAHAVRAALSGFRGTVEGVDIRYIVLDREQDLQESGTNASDYPVRVSMDFLVTYLT
jgi:hypothetical protein